jgi:hypothetical protein
MKSLEIMSYFNSKKNATKVFHCTDKSVLYDVNPERDSSDPDQRRVSSDKRVSFDKYKHVYFFEK